MDDKPADVQYLLYTPQYRTKALRNTISIIYGQVRAFVYALWLLYMHIIGVWGQNGLSLAVDDKTFEGWLVANNGRQAS